MQYVAVVNEATRAMTCPERDEPLDAIAVIPGDAEDMAALVEMLSPEQAAQLMWLASRRAWDRC